MGRGGEGRDGTVDVSGGIIFSHTKPVAYNVQVDICLGQSYVYCSSRATVQVPHNFSEALASIFQDVFGGGKLVPMPRYLSRVLLSSLICTVKIC